MLQQFRPHIRRTQIELPSDFQLQDHTNRFCAAEDLHPGCYIYIPQETQPQYLVATVHSRRLTGHQVKLIYSPSPEVIPPEVYLEKCLVPQALIETPEGMAPISDIAPGDCVWGFQRGRRLPVKVKGIQEKETVLPSLTGKSLTSALKVTLNHLIYYQGRFVHAWQTDFPTIDIKGMVYDLETESGNYYSDGFLMQPGD